MNLEQIYFSLTAIGVVFAVLITLYLAYSLIGAIYTGKCKRRKTKPIIKHEATDGEVAAAIAMALHQYAHDTAHDTESYVITIKRK